MKVLLVGLSIMLVGACATKRYSDKIKDIKNGIVISDQELINEYSKTITANELKEMVYELASKNYEGRSTGKPGHHKASEYIKNYYQSIHVSSPIGEDVYYQQIPKSSLNGSIDKSQNVIAFIEGSVFPEEVIIISGHSDHIGITEKGIHYGADDNASGTSAIMEMAEAFQLAANDGHLPKRSVAFLHLTGEEVGLLGSQYYIEHPIFTIDNTVANLNIDMIGRVDPAHESNENYVYIIGADRLSTELHYISEMANDTFTQLDLDYRLNDENDVNRYYYRSDHYNFARAGIPVIFYFNGEHTDYHKITDTPEKINYDLLAKRAKLIFATAWQLANSLERLKMDNAL